MLYDVLGVGFGPANIALAVAGEEQKIPGVTMRFLEAQKDPVWQGGMLLDGSNIQNHPCRDLVSLRNPRSRYTFINYLFEEGRLLAHLNLPDEFPLRKEYAQYIAWVSGKMSHMVDFGVRVQTVRLTAHREMPVYEVKTTDGARYLGRSLVIGPGRTPYVPPPFDSVKSSHVIHLTEYLPRVRELERAGGVNSVVVIGGSQSSVELVLDLAKRFPRARVTNYVRSFGLRLKDTSPFSEEGFFPDYTAYYYRSSRESKRKLDSYMRPTNYSSVDDDVLHELYRMIYEQRLDGHQRVFVRGNQQVNAISLTGGKVELSISDVHTGDREYDAVDLVVLATGFRDLGPEPHQEAYPRLLADVIDNFEFDKEGYLEVSEDYRLVPQREGIPPIFLNGLCESTHGIGDSGSFSLLSLRTAAIHGALSSCLPQMNHHRGLQSASASAGIPAPGAAVRDDG
ncbi:SidA/IucD/PvdA family monooxygenase [Streptomyces sp. NPDC050658]|uniref:SidA/IucD/PvdA family monooxygenase n=1 Tax=unclassified Streptomyces TaxID=2593676 RepID=UPI00342F17F8